jgi:hypothetical protein
MDSRRQGQIVSVGIAHAGPAPGLDVHIDIDVREQADQRWQERSPLAGLVVHAWEADRESAVVCHLLPLSSGSRETPLREQREHGNGLTVCSCLRCVKRQNQHRRVLAVLRPLRS